MLMKIVGIQGNYMLYSWFRTFFTVPPSWSGRRVLLNFGAVDYEATVYVNGNQTGINRGGYFRFMLDATDYLSSNGTNELQAVSYSKFGTYPD
jgi:beta-galactosidase/beta-glucuronidase